MHGILCVGIAVLVCMLSVLLNFASRKLEDDLPNSSTTKQLFSSAHEVNLQLSASEVQY